MHYEDEHSQNSVLLEHHDVEEFLCDDGRFRGLVSDVKINLFSDGGDSMFGQDPHNYTHASACP